MLLLGINHTLEEGSLREEALINVLENGTTLESPANPSWEQSIKILHSLHLQAVYIATYSMGLVLPMQITVYNTTGTLMLLMTTIPI